MKNRGPNLRLLLAVLLAGCALSAATAQTPAPAPAAAANAAFSAEQIDQIVAPIALYPDALLAQVFMASTYPLEIVKADRFMKEKKLSGKALEEALKAESWDVSVKSLCTFPAVLKRMSDNLDWTTDLGDAFLGQKVEVMNAVQRLRTKAKDAGNLKTTAEQTVVVKEDKTIIIQPTKTEVVYVPTYSPTVVYGPWPYTYYYYAPLYTPPPPGATFVAFSVGVAVGAALWGDCHWGHDHCDIDINVNKYNDFSRNTNINHVNIDNSKTKWTHNENHRHGVNYRNNPAAKPGNQAKARGYGDGPAQKGPGTRDNGPAPKTQDVNKKKTKDDGPSGLGGAKDAKGDRAASGRGASSRGVDAGKLGRKR